MEFFEGTLDYPPEKHHVILYSGGKGSFLAALLLREKGYKFSCYFNDTYYEHASLYRFLADTLAVLFEVDLSDYYTAVPSLALENLPDRGHYLSDQGKAISEKLQGRLIYDAYGTDLLNLADQSNYMPNTRVDLCSRLLKRDLTQRYFTNHFDPATTYAAIGLGLWEDHRLQKAKPHWQPFQLISPLADALVYDEVAIYEQVQAHYGLTLPHLYSIGMAHNNCAGFCVKAGLAHYRDLLERDRDLYLLHEANMEQLFERNASLKPFLRKTIDGKTHYITLRQYRLWLESGSKSPQDLLDEDYGVCNCAI